MLAKALGFCAGLLLAIVEWFSRLPRMSRIAFRVRRCGCGWRFSPRLSRWRRRARAAAARRNNRIARRQLSPPIAPTEWASAAALAALTVLVATHPFRPNLDRGQLEVTVLDVGQGDSIFAAFPGGRTMLIDGGGLSGSEWVGGYRSGTDVGEEVVSPYLWSRGLKRLDVVALTHADHDHLDGLLQRAGKFSGWRIVGRPRRRNGRHSSACSPRRARGASPSCTNREEHDSIGRESKATCSGRRTRRRRRNRPNNNSLVLRLSDGRVHFLLTGDIEKQAEEQLVAEQAQEPLAADFLKVPHHGSKTSSTEAFLQAVEPHFAVVSVGESNAFGHPAPEIVERYQRDGVRLLRTDRDGAITALTDGQNLSVHAFAER